MHTLSGRRFEIGTRFAPTIHDIGVGLSRIPRWAGATVRPWSVLQHSLAAGAMAEASEDPQLILACLLHDMEEMATGDIPSPFKTATQRELGERMREWLWRVAIQLPPPIASVEERVKAIDMALRFGELLCLCHPRSWSDPQFNGDVRAFVEDAKIGLDSVAMVACDAVWEFIDMDEREAISLFDDLVHSLLSDKRVAALKVKL